MTYELMNAHENERALAWLSKYWERPSQVDYFKARSVEEAIALAEEYGGEGRIIAGGTDLLGLIKNKVSSPRALIDIKNLPGLKGITQNYNGIFIGSMALINDIKRSAIITAKYPMLQTTASSIGSPQIRNMATLGGNLLQDVRCWYYRRSPATGNSFNCRRKTGTGQCYAAGGENQYHAVMGGCECFGVCPSDMAASLSALDARVITINAKGGRALAINDLYAPFGNILERGEIISGIQIPEISPQAKQRFLKFRVRNAIDFSIVSVSAIITEEADVVKDVRLVLGGVTYKPYRAVRAEEILKGKTLTEELVTEASKAAISEMTPLSKNYYKIPILEALVKRAIWE
jgi:xanthine dehydrogenase YagS FAD-binding subunit